MKPICQELTLKNVLADPMVRLAMDADHVDPQELVAMLAGVAATLQRAPQPVQLACAH
jgi:hypothetical protein